MIKKKGYRITAFLLLIVMLVFSSCGKDPSGGEKENAADSNITNEESSGGSGTIDGQTQTADNSNFYVSAEALALTQEEQDTSETGAVTITLNGSKIEADSTKGLTINGSVLTITAAGTYRLTGSLEDGEVRIEAGEKERVHLILDNVSIHHQDGAAIYGKSGKITITLKAGTSNQLSDGSEYAGYENEENPPSACLYSQDDLVINGNGTLTIQANCNDGITSKDDLKLAGGILNVTAADDGIVGRDSLQVFAGTITIHSAGDGMKSTNTEKEEKGFIYIADGNIVINSEMDGIQADSSLLIAGGEISITTAGGSANAVMKTDNMNFGFRGNNNTNTETDSVSAKGLKAACNLVITGGTISLDCVDDTVHSNQNIQISGGTLNLLSGDDGIHADDTVAIAGGEITVSKSYEGIEGKVIQISGGTIRVSATDDGVNASDGSSSETAGFGGFGGMNQASADILLSITGGYLYVDAEGDGLDSNGNVTMAGGICIVDGPTNSGNGALDYNGSFTQTGGILIAAGASGMAQAPSEGAQCFLSMTYGSAQSAGSIIRVTDAEGNDIITYSPSKDYSSVIISAPELQEGNTYRLYTGGKAEGSVQDGLYANDAAYSDGTLIAEFTISSSGNYFNENGQTAGNQGGFGGGHGGNGGFGGGRGENIGGPQGNRGGFEGGPEGDGEGFENAPGNNGGAFEGIPEGNGGGFEGAPEGNGGGFEGGPQGNGEGFEGAPQGNNAETNSSQSGDNPEI